MSTREERIEIFRDTMDLCKSDGFLAEAVGESKSRQRVIVGIEDIEVPSAASIQTLFKLGYSVVKAGAFEENVASMRVMEKCRMRRTGQTDTFEYRGVAHHCIYFEITKETNE